MYPYIVEQTCTDGHCFEGDTSTVITIHLVDVPIWFAGDSRVCWILSTTQHMTPLSCTMACSCTTRYAQCISQELPPCHACHLLQSIYVGLVHTFVYLFTYLFIYVFIYSGAGDILCAPALEACISPRPLVFPDTLPKHSCCIESM